MASCGIVMVLFEVVVDNTIMNISGQIIATSHDLTSKGS